VTARVLEFHKPAATKLSRLARLVQRLERVHPRGAEAIERIVDRLLARDRSSASFHE
jgi:hypothetical protein